jgi:photosystem II stability/assembly factor-like uncharacterized protein
VVTLSRLSRRGLLWASALLLVSACAGDEPPPSAAEQPGGAESVGHVHGLGVNPADGALYLATHLGVYRVADGAANRVADRYQDTMAFTVTGPDRFLASGHPDMRERQPPHLGLVESTDAARSWRSLSLRGEADFHALDVAGNRIFGYDGISGRVMRTTDGTSWSAGASLDVLDLAASPDGGTLLATTGTDGLVTSRDGGRRFTPAPDSPALVLLDWVAGGAVVGVDRAGAVYRSTDAGRTWRPSGNAPPGPVALDATPEVWHVATDTDIVSSRDDGRSWQVVFSTQ